MSSANAKRGMSLYRRFYLVALLIVVTTIASGAYAAWTFYSLNHILDRTLDQVRESVSVIAKISKALEREDDAILMAIGGRTDAAQAALEEERANYRHAREGLVSLLTKPEESSAVEALDRETREFRRLGDEILRAAATPNLLERYYAEVNPTLRRALACATALRDLQDQEMQVAGNQAQNLAWRASWVVGVISFGAVVIASLTSLHLTRRVVRPVFQMMFATERVAAGDFDQHLSVGANDELGRLANGFNNMIRSLRDLRALDLDRIEEARALMEATLEALPEAVLLVDQNTRIILANGAARDCFPLLPPPEEVDLAMLQLPSDTFEAVQAVIHENDKESRKPEINSAVSFVQDEIERRLLPVVIPIVGPSIAGRGALLVLYDVTDQLRLEALRTEFIAVASHELKTPLTSLRLTLLLLHEALASVEGRQLELTEAAIGAMNDINRTVDQLLDVSRIDAGGMHLDLERVDLVRLIDQVVASFFPRFEERGVRITVEKSPQPLVANGDGSRLILVFRNLLENALKYTPSDGHVTIRASSMQNAGSVDQRTVQITVTDTGPGIPADFHERVFEKFFRVEHHLPDTIERPKGSGIGLYLCRQIIAAHGGHIRVESTNGNIGTRIALSLPAAE